MAVPRRMDQRTKADLGVPAQLDRGAATRGAVWSAKAKNSLDWYTLTAFCSKIFN
jgi:hypothetical protein